MRAELAGEANPIGGRMRVVKVRGFAVEALAAVFLFKGPIGQADVGLSGSFAFFEWIHTFSVPQNLNGCVGGGGDGGWGDSIAGSRRRSVPAGVYNSANLRNRSRLV